MNIQRDVKVTVEEVNENIKHDMLFNTICEKRKKIILNKYLKVKHIL